MFGEPLNPRLYKALQRVFGHIGIANAGMPFRVRRRESPLCPGRLLSTPISSGEYYCVSCPDCRDTRKRLWINHTWGVRDPETDDDHLYLIHCFNESCFRTRERQERLYDKLFPFNYNARMRLCELTMAATSNEPVSVEPVTATLPEPHLSITDPACQAACDYLASRGFDPDEIAKWWGVGFVFESPVGHYTLRQRLLIPIYTLTPNLDRAPEHVLAGWQARAITDFANDGPKYLSMAGMRKSHVLYGLPEAVATTSPIIIVEGVTDAWRFGSNAVATLGKSISPAQVQLLLRHFRGRPIGVMYDADAVMEGRIVTSKIRQARREWSDTSPVMEVPVPVGRKDAGECSREELWAAVANIFPTTVASGLVRI
ncbi:MAG: hypothetical protein FJ295_21375 [Planctomycetes bacterium]|nr:hypothetical protein [Planctomycetota bacterium]